MTGSRIITEQLELSAMLFMLWRCKIYTNSELLLYQTDDGMTKFAVELHGETEWLSLNQMVELQRTRCILLHMGNCEKVY